MPTIKELPYMTDFKKIAKSIVVHFAHICAYGVETVNNIFHLFKNVIVIQEPMGKVPVHNTPTTPCVD